MSKHYHFNIDIWFTTIIFLFLSIVYGAFLNLIIFYFLALIHELGHFLMAKIFKVKCYKLNFHPLGFSLVMEDISFMKFYKQLLIYLAGPLTFFLNLIIINSFNNFGILSNYQYEVALENNLSLFLFNLIPFYPLDGGKIMELFFYKFFPSKKAKIIRTLLSSIISLCLLLLCIKNNQLLLMFFIGYSILSSIIFFNKEYREYLYSRVGKTLNFEKILTNEKSIFHFKHNILINKDKLLDEDDYIFDLKVKELKNNCDK